MLWQKNKTPALKNVVTRTPTPKEKGVGVPANSPEGGPPTPYAESEAAAEFDEVDFKSGRMEKGQLMAKAYVLDPEEGSLESVHEWFVGKIVKATKVGVWIRYCGERFESKEVS
ncbi:hypothetical protein AB1Y20_015293 [Prymnesium parvum]|uniref:Uncharacterized protein n=1 Tax=Prymnesium parvum TaxID=97485 RepID=A0AB34K012_PRYPA